MVPEVELRIIDYDNIDEWSPWFDQLFLPILPASYAQNLRKAAPQFVEDAYNLTVSIANVKTLQSAADLFFSQALVRVFHGTRADKSQICQIEAEGLRPLILGDHRERISNIISKHPDWPNREEMLDDVLHRLGPEWEKRGAGKREDGQIHVCISKTGLIRSCNHYLTHGAEVYQHVAHYLFADGSGLPFLQRDRSAYVISFLIDYPLATAGASPYGWEQGRLDNLLAEVISAWSYKKAYPEFSTKQMRNSAALRFPGNVSANRIERIELVANSELGVA